jgi:type II secretory pathway component PulL
MGIDDQVTVPPSRNLIMMTKASIACAAIAFLAAAPSSVHAAGTPEQRRACHQDAMKFCRQFVPDVSRIKACMEKNIRNLSPPCRKQFR